MHLLPALAAALAAALVLRRVAIADHHVGLLVVRGRYRRRLDPGVHWMLRPGRRVEVADLRQRTLTVAGQETSTKDGVPVKLALVVAWRLGEPKTALLDTADAAGELYLASQLALRAAVAGVELEELLARRTRLDEALSSAVREEAHALGLDVAHVRVKDVIVSGDLKRAFAEAAKARAEARAKLERARGEAASLRCLTNAARLLQEHRGLLQLRLLETAQAAAAADKNTLVLGLDRADTGTGEKR